MLELPRSLGQSPQEVTLNQQLNLAFSVHLLVLSTENTKMAHLQGSHLYTPGVMFCGGPENCRGYRLGRGCLSWSCSKDTLKFSQWDGELDTGWEGPGDFTEMSFGDVPFMNCTVTLSGG
jgi:hypothetical protein